MADKLPRTFPFFDLNASVFVSQLGSLLLHVAFLSAVFLVPPLPQSISLDTIDSEDRFARYLVTPTTLITTEQRLPANRVVTFGGAQKFATGPGRRLTKNKARNGSRESHEYSAPGGSGMRHAGEEGRLGRPDAAIAERRFAVAGPSPDVERHLARVREDMRASVLQALRSSAPTSPFGQLVASGPDPESHLGALMGHRIGDARGLHGLGLRGTGRGGGGRGEGTIGLGNIAVVGHGAGGGGGSGYGRGDGHGGSGSGYGRAGGRILTRRASVPAIPRGSARVAGSLDRELIRRYIRRHRAEIRHCFASRLAQRPDLAGRVLLRFTIERDGRVLSSTVARSSIADANVETCVARVVQRIHFPAPEGDERIIVSYPFFFHVGG